MALRKCFVTKLTFCQCILLALCLATILSTFSYTYYDNVSKTRGYTSKTTLFSGKDNTTHVYTNSNTDHISEAIVSKSSSLVVTTTKAPLRPKILVWAKQYHKIEYTLPDQPIDGGGCDFTWDRKEYESSDAVLFYMKTCKAKDLPNKEKRRPHQVFVWWSHESPWTVLHYYHHDLKDFNNYFNYTMTHRGDSDVFAPYAPTPAMDYFLQRVGRGAEMRDKTLMDHPPMSEERFKEELDWLMTQKSKFVSWVVSDCHEVAGARSRMTFFESLTKQGKLNVDKLGKCANRPIPMNMTILLETLQPYKFYLAFENAIHCRDYITEKSLVNGLVGGTVPVIYGPTKEDSAKILPPGSFIHVDDFQNVSALAGYLNYLNKNDTAYREYFKWWKAPGTHVIPRFNFNYGSNFKSRDSNWLKTWNLAIQDDMMEFERFGLYHLCRKLIDKEHYTSSKTIPDLHQFWFSTEKHECVGR